jgi:photosystem II stability/assembly factor-like uncharacterized protein
MLVPLIVTACSSTATATTNATSPAAAPSTLPTAFPKLPAVTAIAGLDASRAWALTSDSLYATADSGKTWERIAAADISGARGIAVLDDRHLLIGAIGEDGLSVDIRSSDDSGATWATIPIKVGGQPGDLSFAVDGDVIAVLVTQTTSANASEANLFISDSANQYVEREVPASGFLSVTARDELWLSGGTTGNQLWSSRNGGVSWSENKSLANLGVEIGVGPVRRVSGALLVPVTINGPSTTEAVVRSDDNGETWKPAATLDVGGDTARGVALSSSVAGDRLMILSPSHGLYAISPDSASVNPVGGKDPLPAGDTVLNFVGADIGWALVTERGCLASKSNCYVSTQIFSTADGGQTWAQATAVGAP